MAATVDKDLHELGKGIYAHSQLPGSWGWSNAGLITDGEQSLLVDTLFDEKITTTTTAPGLTYSPSTRHDRTRVGFPTADPGWRTWSELTVPATLRPAMRGNHRRASWRGSCSSSRA